jgi:hypothetical protein
MVAAILREPRCAIRAVQPFGPPIRTGSAAQRTAAFHVALDRAAEAEREPAGSA